MNSRIFVAGSTCIGQNHIKNKQPNQDYFSIYKRNGLTVIVAADGIGSHKYSHIGARTIVRSVIRQYKRINKSQHGQINIQKINSAIIQDYQNRLSDKVKNQAGTTCIYAALFDNFIVFGQIGDGVCCFSIDKTFEKLQSGRGDFANEVDCANGTGSNSHWNYSLIKIKKETVKRIDIMIATDGVSDDIIPEKLEPFMKYIIDNTEKYNSSRKKKMYISSVLSNWITPLSYDDKTLIVYRRDKYE